MSIASRTGPTLLALAVVGVLGLAGVADLALATTSGEGAVRVRSLLADLSRETLDALDAREGPPVATLEPAAQLAAVLETSTPYRFESGPVSVVTDTRWFQTRAGDGPGAPLLVLRRWPGDTVLALYALGGPAAAEGTPPALPGCRLERAGSAERGEWRGTLGTEAGERPVTWIERAIAGSPSRLGALLLPGDAGLGESATDDLLLELRAVADRVQIHPEAWKRAPALAPDRAPELPPGSDLPRDADETRDPWQLARAAEFTIGLPPGVRARAIEPALPGPLAVPGALLWFRGRYTDAEGVRVAIGDARRAGYVALVSPRAEKWSSGELPPLGAPTAVRRAAEAFEVAAEHTDSVGARAERWREGGFDGEWLVFRLLRSGQGVEIGVPLLEGRRSPSLFWIPTTWRPADAPPAPPPIDPAARFGIEFERLGRAERRERPWTEGYLTVPGLRAELPKDWLPAASLRSRDGYPVRFVDLTGRELGRLSRVAAADAVAIVDGQDGWGAIRGGAGRTVSRVLSRADGSRLFVATEGQAFLFEPERGPGARPEEWNRLIRSVRLLRSGR